MKRGILALEDADLSADIPAEELTEERIDAEHVELQDEFAQTEQAGDEIAEARGMADTIDAMANTVEESVTPTEAIPEPQGLPQPAAEVVEAALEHFCQRLGVTKKIVPAMESFEKDRLASSKIALENLNTLRDAIDKRLAVAQEGILERIGNAFSRAFTSNKKMLAAVSKLHSSEVGDERSLGEPAWARVFGVVGKSPVKGSDVAALMGAVAKSSAKLAKAIDGAATHLERIRGELDRKLVGSADGAVEAIEKHGESIMDLLRDSTKEMAVDVHRGKSDVEIMSCDKGSFDKIVKLMGGREEEMELDRAWSRFNRAYGALDATNEHAGSGTLGGAMVALAMMASADRRATQRVLSKIRGEAGEEAFEAARTLGQYATACRHGAYKYLAASCAK